MGAMDGAPPTPRKVTMRSPKASDARSSHSSTPDSLHSPAPRRPGTADAQGTSPMPPKAASLRSPMAMTMSLQERRIKWMAKLSEEEHMDLQFAFCGESLRRVSYYYFNRPALQDDSEGELTAMYPQRHIPHSQTPQHGAPLAAVDIAQLTISPQAT